MSAYATHTDEELVRLIKTGDTAAFTEAYNRYWEQLLALGYYYTHQKQAAEDIVHEVFTSLWARRTELPIQSLKAYLATAVKFSVFKTIARDKRRRELQQGMNIPEHTTDVEEKLDARFLQDYLNGVVEQLPDKARLVFTYSRAEELSVKEIATKMDLSPKAVEYHMTKALRALKEAVKKIKFFFV
ncbi:RNA polymerase sigma factor [Flavisolibacter tropicus]|uniref:RNA polymerase sigma-70 factor n=1 Tax=Flavisolibacter tropicus TaxID=1492898 RepID=A0A172U2X2_9BACT|nr:RNA polymerase sigma-70 factor [Flavisolibacter tropicus]ANE53582.1 RNA polymerase sigma-70 factor [Flavisolibacter tropicus]